jgi:hypothetical protein
MTGKPLVPLIEYEMADEAVRAVYDDIMATRQVDWINNFWKVLAHDPAVLKRTWETIKEVMAPGALDPLVKEMIYILHLFAYGVGAQAGHERSADDGAACRGRHGQSDEPAGERASSAHRRAVRAARIGQEPRPRIRGQ